MGPFDDEEEDDNRQSVANALSGSDEAAPPNVPAVVVPYVEPSDDTTAQDMGPEYRTNELQPQQDTSSDNVMIQDSDGQDEQPLTAPAPPQFKPYSTEPADAANELAKEKGDFAAKVASGAYKPSVWRNIGAGLAAAATGWKSGAEAGARIGQGIRSAPLDRATANEARTEQGTQAKIDAGNIANQGIQRENQNEATKANWADRDFANQARVRDWNAQAEQRKEYAYQRSLKTVPVDKNNPMGEWQQVDPTGKVVARGLPPPASIKDDPKYKAAQASETIRSIEMPEGRPGDSIQLQDANGKPVTGNIRNYDYRRGVVVVQTPDGKTAALPTQGKPLGANERASILAGRQIGPTEHTTISIRENPDGSAVTPRGPMNPADKPNADIAASAIVSDAMQKKQNLVDSYVRQPDGSYALDPSLKGTVNMPDSLSPQEFHDKIEEIGRTTPNKALARFGRQIDENGNLVGGQPQVQQPSPAPAALPPRPQAAAPAQQPAAAGLPQGGGKPLTDPALARQFLAAAGGDKNKARQLAQQSGWKF